MEGQVDEWRVGIGGGGAWSRDKGGGSAGKVVNGEVGARHPLWGRADDDILLSHSSMASLWSPPGFRVHDPIKT